MMNRKIERIEVTKEDIEQGERENSTCCPVALAIKRTTGRKVNVGRQIVKFYNEIIDKHDYYPLPLCATNFIKRFDDMRSVEPFSFYLEVGAIE